ncbi:helix-turn-helix transcriptional regulator [Clostridium sp. 19966]|uniref:helix-turn-helix domain-containing protein n=1 Tax=Clostridium sp. 19966 TaxID=2768166 RepID=UPI0028DF1CF1|nr:helix-turn-helix transcriptional regulator [Clostridium sp. 19966]MDT8715471.1 helix-turn-helix transcriptional regulator [Clostridium sp. 19966]
MEREQILKKLIQETGLSMKAFSEKAGLPNTTLYSMLERGIGKAAVDNVIKVCRALNITIEDLENMVSNPNDTPSEAKVRTEIDTIAAHLEGKNVTPQKMKLLEKYIDALFEDED